MDGKKVIYGEKVMLRPITMEDTPLIVRWRNTESVRKNFIFRERFTEEMHNNWMRTKVASGEVVGTSATVTGRGVVSGRCDQISAGRPAAGRGRSARRKASRTWLGRESGRVGGSPASRSVTTARAFPIAAVILRIAWL